MPVLTKYSLELKERAVRLVLDALNQDGGGRGACAAIGQQLGSRRIRGWVHRVQVDQGLRPGMTTDDATRLVELERENRELRRANAIVKSEFGALRPTGNCRSPRPATTRRRPCHCRSAL